MPNTETTAEKPPDEQPEAGVEFLQAGKSMLFRFLGPRLTHDVVWTDRRLIYPRVDRAARGISLALLVWIAWKVAVIATDIHALTLLQGAR